MITYTATRAATAAAAATSTVAVGDNSNDASAAPFACRTLSVDVDFGTLDSNSARTTVYSVPWVKASPRPLAVCVGKVTDVAFAGDEEALMRGVHAIVTNVVDGVSFDVFAYAEGGTNGIYTIRIMGV